MGKCIILQGILDDLNAASYDSILADEVTSHNVEHLAISARFVNKNRDIREEFYPLWSWKGSLVRRLLKASWSS